MSQALTAGEWDDERDACAALDAMIQSTGLFDIHREVRGHYMLPRTDTPNRLPRIDRVLFPSSQLIGNLGWRYGPVGVECKRSGEKLGRPVSQMMDYSRAVWDVGDGLWVNLRYVLLWPLEKQHSELASIMSQNRLGGIALNGTFHSGEAVLARIVDGKMSVPIVPPHGNKNGSR
jgi:hypothetical protein